MSEIGNYEIDNNDAVCPNCGYKQYQELCDLRLHDGDEYDFVCPECKTKCKICFCISHSFMTVITELPTEAK